MIKVRKKKIGNSYYLLTENTKTGKKTKQKVYKDVYDGFGK